MKDVDNMVIKVGSAVLAREDGSLDMDVMRGIVSNIAGLMRQGASVVLVSSGAVASGKVRKELGQDFPVEANCFTKDITRQQVLAAIGQPNLMATYKDLLQEHGLHLAQILVTRSDFVHREKYLSLRSVIENLLRMGILPIINENDVLSDEELQFSDNDQLGCLIASMVHADMFLILTNVDGVYDRSPEDPRARRIHEIKDVESALKTIKASKSAQGRGGMRSKLQTAHMAVSLGIPMRIANGKELNVISRVIEGDDSLGTSFPTHKMKKKPLKAWLVSAAHPKGGLVVNICLADILSRKKSVSILFAGIDHVEGEFYEGDVVDVKDDEGKVYGRGQTRYSSDQLSDRIKKEKNKGFEGGRIDQAQSKNVVVHYDHFSYTI